LLEVGLVALNALQIVLIQLDVDEIQALHVVNALAIALIENLQREDLNPLDEAKGIQRLTEEFGMTHAEAAEAVGRSRAAITNALRLLELAPPVQALLREGKLDMGHARALLALPALKQIDLALEAVARQLSVRQVEKRVAGLTARPATRARSTRFEMPGSSCGERTRPFSIVTAKSGSIALSVPRRLPVSVTAPSPLRLVPAGAYCANVARLAFASTLIVP